MVFLTVGLAACHPKQSPQLRVLGVDAAHRHEVVFVQVTNPAAKPMRLTKLEYVFAAGSAKISEGELDLARDVPAGAAIVVEVPFEASDQPMTLRGKLTAQLDDLERIFKVSAEIDPVK
jgi:LEA14-like dessication related protein